MAEAPNEDDEIIPADPVVPESEDEAEGRRHSQTYTARPEYEELRVLPGEASSNGEVPQVAGEGRHVVTRTAEHQLSRGGEVIPNLPLERHILIGSAVFAFVGLLSGAVIVSIGVVISGLIGFHANQAAPPIWWCGILPFLVSMAGIQMLAKRNRKQLYQWGIVMLLVAVTETAVMGWVGNFTTSHYDAWPPHLISSVCKQYDTEPMCFCQDEYHGVYSQLELPGLKYIYEGVLPDQIKWRETMFQECDVVRLVSELYFSCMAFWCLYVVTSITACVIAHAGSVCSKPRNRFQRLEEEVESNMVLTQEDLESQATTPSTSSPASNRGRRSSPHRKRSSPKNDSPEPGTSSDSNNVTTVAEVEHVALVI